MAVHLHADTPEYHRPWWIRAVVNEGKISPEEGYRLYEALQNQPEPIEQQETENTTTHSENDLDSEMRKRMNGIYKDAEPILRKTILSALETASFVADTVREKIREELNAEGDELSGE